jgi:hypothetical protein
MGQVMATMDEKEGIVEAVFDLGKLNDARDAILEVAKVCPWVP